MTFKIIELVNSENWMILFTFVLLLIAKLGIQNWY